MTAPVFFAGRRFYVEGNTIECEQRLYTLPNGDTVRRLGFPVVAINQNMANPEYVARKICNMMQDLAKREAAQGLDADGAPPLTPDAAS